VTNIIRAVLADDEALLRDHLKALLAECWPELVIAGEAGNGVQALQLIETLQPDIAFLDIKMPKPGGLDVAREVAGQCHLVFVTAYDKFALQAFEAEAVDYLLKPVTSERLTSCIKRLQKRMGQPAPDLQKLIDLLKTPSSEDYTQWIRASCQDEVHVIAIADVLYFQSADKYTTVFTAEREYIVRTSLKELESRLDPTQFWRIHRSTLVSVQHIASSKKNLAGLTTVFLRDNKTTLPVSRAYQYLFKAE
jgi:DNA-binding LytR/AlgR family response regulator